MIETGSPQRGPQLSASDPYAVDDTILATALPLLGFTTASSPNEAYGSPIPESAQHDTVTYDVEGELLTGIYSFGPYGQPLSEDVYRDGVLAMSTNYVWTTVAGGYALALVFIQDYTQQDVLILWEIDITRAQPVLLTFGGEMTATLASLASWITSACIPSPVFAAEAKVTASGCGWRASTVLAGLAGVAASGAGLVAAVYSGNPWAISAAVGGAFTATVNVVDQARKFQRECTQRHQ